MSKDQKGYLCICLAFSMLIAAPLWACDIPVFRYALEYWPADLYVVTVVHRGPLNPEEQALLKRLQEVSAELAANILVETVDLAQEPDGEMAQLWRSQSQPRLPWLVVRYSRPLEISEPVWTEHFTAEAVETLLHSPVRAEIAERLLAGETAVWVLIESGVKERDEAAAQLLETQLKRMEETLELPVLSDYLGYMLETEETNLKVSFSLIRVARTDPKERMLIQTLLQRDSGDGEGVQPAAFPIFGRGRALCALFGEDINEGNVEEICSFLIGPCSCQVKELNPGMDLLLAAEWDEMVDEQLAEYAYAQPPPFTDLSDSVAEEDRSSGMLWRNVLIAVSFQFVVVMIATCILLWRKRKRESGTV
ncbi:MAG TPA: hypothetical protein EYP85_02110 [Armatimonadetes bacterium]|nr:hypothetical protein [Armatimonadota bacterium]